MKILYHHRTASKDGQAVHIDELIGALREQGHDVRVVAPTTTNATTFELGGEVGWVRRLRDRLPKAAYELLELGYSLVAYLQLRKAAREFRPDVIYERYNLFLLAGVMLRWRTGLPLLLEVNSPLVDERMRFGGLGMPWLGRWAEAAAWRRADVVLPVTRVLAEHIASHGVPRERIVVVANGINEAHFARAPSASDAKAALGWQDDLVLGFTGFVREWHGVDRVLRWLAGSLAPTNARLLVVGDGPARADLERLAGELNLMHRVRFTGMVAREHVPRWIASFDIALQPAVVPYASPLKLFEYLALGKAIIAPRLPNIEEVLVDGMNALLFEPAVEGGFEAALARLCTDVELRQRIARGAATSIERLGLTWRSNAMRVAHMADLLRQGRPATDMPAVQAQVS